MFEYPPRALTYFAALAEVPPFVAFESDSSVSSASKLLPLPGVLRSNFLIKKFAPKK